MLAILLTAMVLLWAIPMAALAEEIGEDEMPYLDSLKITDYDGKVTYDLEPEFDPNIFEYTLRTPDYETQVAISAVTPPDTRWGLEYWSWNDMFGNYVGTSRPYGNTTKEYFAVDANLGGMGTKATKYKIFNKQYPTLTDLIVDGIMDKSFNKANNEYHIYVDSNKDGVDILAKGYKATYSLTIGGAVVVPNEVYHLAYNWQGGNTMTVPVMVSYANASESNTYRLVLEKSPLNNKPFIMTQPTDADYIMGDNANALTVIASANGAMKYEWYKNTANKTEGATKIAGAEESTYTPPITEAGTIYYFCRITNTDKSTDNVTDTKIVKVTTDLNPTPTVKINQQGEPLPTNDGYPYQDTKGIAYSINDVAEKLTLNCSSAVPGGVYSYQWMKGTNAVSNGGVYYTTEAECVPDTAMATPKGVWYFCKVTYEFKGKTYTAYSDKCYVYVKATEAVKPNFTKQPESKTYIIGDKAVAMSVTASRTDNGSITYQWYKNTENSNIGGTPIDGAIRNTYTPESLTEKGIVHYYCIATNTLQQFSESNVSNTAVIEFLPAEEIVGNTFEGKGTKVEPYLLKNADDFEKLADLVNNQHMTFNGKYLKMTADIALPDNWQGLGVLSGSGSNGTNKKPFSGTLNGDNHVLTFAYGSHPLFKYGRETSVENLRIIAPYIPYNGLVEVYGVDKGADGSSYTWTLNAKNITILSGSVIKGSGFIGGYASGSNPIYISGCTVESGVKIGYDANADAPVRSGNIGSFGGDFNGTIINCTSAATVYGGKYVGGIVGSKGQTVGAYSILNCSFTGEVIATGTYVGGIAGGGYAGTQWGVASAPNTPCANIENCYVSGKIAGADKVGGIIGGEEGCTQAWGTAHIRNNIFTGKIKSESGNNIGGIAGCLASLNKMNAIESNYYLASSADKGIGNVRYVDTNCETHETESGSTYFDTSKDMSLQELPDGVSKPNHNRTDDPLGADANKLTAAVTSDQLESGDITDALNNSNGSFKNWVQGDKQPVHSDTPVAYKLEISGEYKTVYTTGDALDLTGAVIKATLSDGTIKTLDASELEITGYNKNVRGIQTIKLIYGAATTVLKVTVLKPESGKIKVYLQIMGDTAHGVSEEIHTLKGENLTQWLEKTAYEVDTNATVLDVLTKAMEEKGMTFKNESGNYIQQITNGDITIGEMTNGPASGWMFTLNGAYGDLSVNEQFLENGDVIILHYTDDYSMEDWSAGISVSEIIAMIDALPAANMLTLTDASAVAKANDAFHALSEAEKTLISELKQEKLEAAVLKIAELKRAALANFEEAYIKTGNLLFGSLENNAVFENEWPIIGLARTGELTNEIKSTYYDSIVEILRTNASAKFSENKSTENARVILALTAMGKDVTNTAGYNLLEPLADLDYLNIQGINGPIWALIAFNSHNYDIPNTASGIQATRDNLIESILSAQLADGGWALTGIETDPDIAAMALQALSPYYNSNAAVKSAADRAIECLSKMQNADGGYRSYGTTNSESCAQIITALTALGIDPLTDTRFIKNGNSVAEALLGFYTEGGGFEHVTGEGINGMATEQGYCALAAYFRMVNGKTALYDMNDVTITESENHKPTNPDDIDSIKPDSNKPNTDKNSPDTGDSGRAASAATAVIISLASMALLRRKKIIKAEITGIPTVHIRRRRYSNVELRGIINEFF